MPHYKDYNNQVHFIESGEFINLLPAGCVEITDEEADAIRVANTPIPVYQCDAWQIRKALNTLVLRKAVEDAVALSTDQTLKDGWEFATILRSDDPFVVAMGAALGKTQAEVDQIIQLASSL